MPSMGERKHTMDNNKIELQNKIIDYENAVEDSVKDIEMATMALKELLNEYDWSYAPDARKAIEHASTVGGSQDEIAQFSYKYISDYRKIIWLIQIAFDYCFLVSKNIDYIYNGGARNE